MKIIISLAMLAVWFVVFSILIPKFGAARVWKWCAATFVAISAASGALFWLLK
ncbi:MAG: hypothetical protein MJ025_03595 [Victivallaceae bacterium]|nr:hypothetical protein [Victivallaceae bacterium]